MRLSILSKTAISTLGCTALAAIILTGCFETAPECEECPTINCPGRGQSDLPAPEELKPIPKAETASTRPTFSWNNVDTAEYYEFQVAEIEEELEDSKLQTVDKSDYSSITSYIPKEFLKNNCTHYWRVRSVRGSAYSHWTPSRSLTVRWGSVSGLTPLNGTVSEVTKPTLSWDNSVSEIKYFELQINTSTEEFGEGHTIVVPAKAYSGATTYTPDTGLANYQTHYWRVRAVDDDEQATDWSDTMSIEIDWGAMENVRPLDGADFTTMSPTLSWNNFAGVHHFEIQIASHRDSVLSAEPRLHDVTPYTGATTYTPWPKLKNNVTHYWRVRGVDAEGQTTRWSEIAGFSVHWGDIVLSTPLNGAEVSNGFKLQWDRVSDADYYELQLAESEGGIDSAEPILVENTSFSTNQPAHSPADLTPGDSYYWRVRAVDSDGFYGAWSKIRSFSLGS